ncbi:MAG: ornithine carbamoyltransferase [Sandaracinaceae bacterium]|nr:ornithine carbamoyltransferase [Sandaracinaceae bacterium]
MTRHFLSLLDLEAEELTALLDRADVLRAERGTTKERPLEGKTVVVLLEKASTRTRLSFEVGIHELGGRPLTLIAKDTQIGRGEPLPDTARMLSGYAHGVVFRTSGHDRVEQLAAHASIPVINGLSERYHPCQLLADLQTVRAERPLAGTRVAWIGDGNNMAHSWILAAARTGMSLRLASPEHYAPAPDIVGLAESLGADVEVVVDPREAVEGAHVVTTDVWASMGQEDENAERQRAFRDYQVDAALMGRADASAIFLHCLPAHRGEEVSADVIDGPASRVWIEAENRLHAQKALLEALFGAQWMESARKGR